MLRAKSGRSLLPALLIVTCCIAPAAGHASSVYSFGCFAPGASLTNCAAAASQLTLDVSDAGGDQVLFLFRNAGTSPLSITDIYFDDGTLLGIASIVTYNDPGTRVAFGLGARPPELPGGVNLNPRFETSGYAGSPHYFSIDSNSGQPGTMNNGVNPGERLGVLFDLLPGATYSGTLAAFALAGAADGLRVGLHVQGFGDGGSVSLVNSPDANDMTPVPLPAAAPLLLVGIVGLARYAQRRSF